MQRRDFLSLGLAASVYAGLPGTLTAASRKPKILLRSSWQTVNIGDIAHTPGVLSLLEKYLPDAELYLWPSSVGNGVKEILLTRFPNLKIVQGSSDLKEAFDQCDFLLHGSGASLVAEHHVRQWSEATGKPYGIFGITLPPKKSSSTVATSKEKLERTIGVLNQAEFVYFRDGKSLEFAKSQGCSAPVMEFGPDGAFACDLRQEELAKAFLDKHDLEEGKFVCCIPRLRYTPYWTIPEKKRAFNPEKHARNEEMKEHDHAPLREAIIQIVEQSDHKVLLCPEDQTQMRVGRELLLEKLPKSILPRVVWRPNYWLTGEAISTYVRSAGLFGNEMHSPIMCIGHGVPAIVCRWEEQTSKGYMWEDIGLKDWLFNLDVESEVEQVAPTVLSMAQNGEASRKKAAAARDFVEERQKQAMENLASILV
ncbi:polysaccharide pyruvyl transferase family protein [Calycomorphotria hydatis]|uniref:Polysaccharide pyruvyl transferase n=1 Tax=Calycomorphotria hydatis TaxID=2528027 RepID=A0A517TDP5_9PLAN|nr:polysaccharide pyruvyl transferase family protein [Calycomorphotria hydatis]QDT66491.1 Polysaccharide pyruvyl transferase [Calycomorphotria hydatis]